MNLVLERIILSTQMSAKRELVEKLTAKGAEVMVVSDTKEFKDLAETREYKHYIVDPDMPMEYLTKSLNCAKQNGIGIHFVSGTDYPVSLMLKWKNDFGAHGMILTNDLAAIPKYVRSVSRRQI